MPKAKTKSKGFESTIDIKLGIVLKVQDKESVVVAEKIVSNLKKAYPIFIESTTLRGFSKTARKSIQEVTTTKLFNEASVLLVIGGDGTILRCARHLLHGNAWRNCKILGVNTGHLGFLTCLNAENAIKELPTILEKTESMAIEKHSALRVSVQKKKGKEKIYHVLNDCVLSKGSLSRIFEFHLDLNDQPLSSYRADGLIVSPPTGSTAYNLAAGGAIVQPGIEAIQLTPIAAQYFSNKPILVHDQNKIRLRLGRHSTDVFLTLDGHTGLKIDDDHQVLISKSEKTVQFWVPKDRLMTHYFDSLRQKLNWGLVSSSRT